MKKSVVASRGDHGGSLVLSGVQRGHARGEGGREREVVVREDDWGYVRQSWCGTGGGGCCGDGEVGDGSGSPPASARCAGAPSPCTLR